MTSVKKMASKKRNLQSLNTRGSSTTSSSINSRGHIHLCKICDEAIAEPDTKIKGDDSIFCNGECDGWIHRRCAGLSKAKFAVYTSTDESVKFYCPTCRVSRLEASMSALQQELHELSASSKYLAAEVNTLKRLPFGNTSSCASISPVLPAAATSTDSPPEFRPHTNNPGRSKYDRKSNVVIFGIKEQPKGTKRHERLSRDLEESTSLLSSIDRSINDCSIRECVRLGKYDESKCRPVLASLNRSRDVLSIISKVAASRLSLPPGIQVKPDLSKEERATKACLLKERRALIDAGVFRSQISIRKNQLFIADRLHGKVDPVNFSFQKGPFINDYIASALESINTSSHSKETQALAQINSPAPINVNSRLHRNVLDGSNSQSPHPSDVAPQHTHLTPSVSQPDSQASTSPTDTPN